jgi:hypothetical protein
MVKGNDYRFLKEYGFDAEESIEKYLPSIDDYPTPIEKVG